MNYNPTTTTHVDIPNVQPCPCCGRCPTCGQYKPRTSFYSGTTSGSCGMVNISNTTEAKAPFTYT